MRPPFVRIIALILSLLASADRALAIGWDRDDFIISGAPNFPQRIGIFDHDFTFKGYLEQNFVGVQGMDFDAQGRLVATSSLNAAVRIYEPSGVLVGGFTQANSPMLVPAGDLKIAPDGSYVLGTLSSGARVFTPQGTFVRQYGDGSSAGVALVPGNRLWSSGGTNTTVRIFDTVTGDEVGSFPISPQMRAASMQYSAMTNTVLIVDPDRDAGGVYERDLSGALLGEFHLPIAQTNCNGATRGPNGHVFGTSNNLTVDIVEWLPDGTVAQSFNVYPSSVTPVRILWAGVVPEPAPVLSAGLFGCALLAIRLRAPTPRSVTAPTFS